MFRRTVLSRSLAAAGAVTLATLLAWPAQAAEEGTIKIGWLSSLTGALSSAAIAENQGVH